MSVLQEIGRQTDLPLHEDVAFEEACTTNEIARRLLDQCPSLSPLVDRLALAAEHDVMVLLTGETGSGKTSLARLIHACSPRRREPFLAVPCGALAPHLFESEFFGHVRGAFTSADRTKMGKFAAAGRGTMLLDEIDSLSVDKQAALLRVIETGEYEPVGSNTTERSACRIIVASNTNLEELVEEGTFRHDLYYRVNVLSFHLRPLRERIDDIAPLARSMAARFGAKYSKDVDDISPDCLAALESYAWPGNIRELENVVQQAVLVSQGPVLLLRHLPKLIQDQAATDHFAPTALDILKHHRERLERNLIQRVLANHANQRGRAASELGMSRMTLYKKMKKYGFGKSRVAG